MPPLKLASVDQAALRGDLQAVNGFIEKNAYEPVYLTPPVYLNGATQERLTIGGTGRDQSAWKLPGASIPVILWALPVPRGFASGILTLDIFYTGALGSTNNISLTYNTDPIAVGDVPPQGSTGTVTMPGPAVAGTILQKTTTTQVTVTGNDLYLQLKIFRNNPDAYGANDVWIAALRPLFYARR